MKRRTRRLLGGILLAAGLVLAVVAVGPLSWGLGALIALALILGGWHLLTYRTPYEWPAEGAVR